MQPYDMEVYHVGCAFWVKFANGNLMAAPNCPKNSHVIIIPIMLSLMAILDMRGEAERVLYFFENERVLLCCVWIEEFYFDRNFILLGILFPVI